MRISSPVAVVGVIAGLVLCGGVAAATTTARPPAVTAASGAATRGAAALIDTSTEAGYTAITPCRIVDTRLAGGLISAAAPRSFVAVGATGFTAQGGAATGCGIPDAAVAIEADVVAVGASGRGTLKVYPDGVAAPQASYLNFRDGKALANGGAITIDATHAQHFTVATSRPTQVVVDVTGYFIRPMWALVDADGTLLKGSRATGVSKRGIGDYDVSFDRDITLCAFNVVPVAGALIYDTERDFSPTSAVEVAFLASSDQSNLDVEFYLRVTC